MRILQKADVILAVGTRLSYFGTLPQYDINYFPKTAKIVQIDINPRHIAKTHPVAVGWGHPLSTMIDAACSAATHALVGSSASGSSTAWSSYSSPSWSVTWNAG